MYKRTNQFTTAKYARHLLIAFSLTAAVSACSSDDNDVIPVIPPSDGAELKLDGGGGAGAPNAVYVDFSADKQTSVVRSSWDLGFYNGNDFRVVTNYTSSISVAALNKTDITQVDLDDTTGVSLAIGQGAGALSMIDDVTGDIAKTAIAAVSANDAENKVYLVKPETASATDHTTWFKIRVSRNGSGYKLQYAKLNETTIRTADIGKDEGFNFSFFSLGAAKTTAVEPKKAEWDIQWSYGVYSTSFGAGLIPYLFSDFLFINNLGGVTAAEATTADGFNYDSFKPSDLANTKLVFSGARDAIGSKWRITSGATLGIKTDRFYVVKDSAGNYYKLRFISAGIGQDGGQRGYPEIAYKLIK